MLYLVIFVFAAAGAITFLLMLKINILLEYTRDHWDDHFTVSFFTLRGLLKHKVEIPLIDLDREGIRFQKVTEKGKKEEEADKEKGVASFFRLINKFEVVRDYYRQNHTLICEIRDYLRTRVVCKDFSVKIEVGSEDAAYTGIATGFVWSVIGNLVSYIENNFTLQKRTLRVKPLFNQNKFKVDFYCIFHIKIVHIIVIGRKFLLKSIMKRLGFKNKNSIGGGVCG